MIIFAYSIVASTRLLYLLLSFGRFLTAQTQDRKVSNNLKKIEREKNKEGKRTSRRTMHLD